MVTPLRELAYLPKGALDPHDLPADVQRAGLRPEEIIAQAEAAQGKQPEEAK